MSYPFLFSVQLTISKVSEILQGPVTVNTSYLDYLNNIILTLTFTSIITNSHFALCGSISQLFSFQPFPS